MIRKTHLYQILPSHQSSSNKLAKSMMGLYMVPTSIRLSLKMLRKTIPSHGLDYPNFCGCLMAVNSRYLRIFGTKPLLDHHPISSRLSWPIIFKEKETPTRKCSWTETKYLEPPSTSYLGPSKTIATVIAKPFWKQNSKYCRSCVKKNSNQWIVACRCCMYLYWVEKCYNSSHGNGSTTWQLSVMENELEYSLAKSPVMV
jgi:hypothetical protein